MRIYLAARYSRRGELNQYANDLRSFGHTVDARWLLGNHENPANLEGNPVRDRVWALEDYEDVFRADLLIAFSEAPGGPGRKAEYNFRRKVTEAKAATARHCTKNWLMAEFFQGNVDGNHPFGVPIMISIATLADRAY